jgi:hypothetical protein
MANEEIGKLDVVPQVLPDFLLRRALDVYEIATDLNVRTVDDWELRADFLDQGDQTWHLRIVYMEDVNIGTISAIPE